MASNAMKRAAFWEKRAELDLARAEDARLTEVYRGYTITFDRFAPVTGQWRGVRFGVGLCNNSLESVKRMIDVRIYEAQNSGPIHSPHGYRIP